MREEIRGSKATEDFESQDKELVLHMGVPRAPVEGCEEQRHSCHMVLSS